MHTPGRPQWPNGRSFAHPAHVVDAEVSGGPTLDGVDSATRGAVPVVVDAGDGVVAGGE